MPHLRCVTSSEFAPDFNKCKKNLEVHLKSCLLIPSWYLLVQSQE